MKSILSRNLLWLLGLGVVLAAAGCHGNSQNAANTGQALQQQYDTDPATANVAPVASGGTSAEESGEQQAEPAADQGYADQPTDESADEQAYGIQPEETAPQPPPPLPDYDQPPCPGDNYIWTPGYWSYAPTGYYWVPGAWVEAPYAGALWTPGYWAYAHGRYDYFPGYWGNYVGFYGGIDYGFGYTGFGYHGGFWRDGRFDYNRSVNNINERSERNYYNYPVRGNGTSRVSFNGGTGGVQAHPRMAELAALREPRVPPMNTQVQLRDQARNDHGQFAQVNHGHPAQTAFNRPVAAEHGVHPTARPVRNLPAGARIAPQTARNARPADQPERNPVNTVGPPRTGEHQPEPVYPETNRPQQRYGQPMHSQATPGEPTRPQSNRESPRWSQQQQTGRTRQEQEQPGRTRQEQQQPDRAPQARQEPNRTQTMHTEPGRATTSRPQPMQHEPGRTEPGRSSSQHSQPEERKPGGDHHEQH